jgi:hypothetical protein
VVNAAEDLMKQITYGFADLAELVDHMMVHLELAPREARIAAGWVLCVHRNEDLLEAIRETLEDNQFSGHKIASLASGMFGLKISYQGDSVVYIADPNDPADSAERAVARLLKVGSGESTSRAPPY